MKNLRMVSPEFLSSEVSIEQEVATIKMGKPHVVILGAGASRATCPNGDKSGKTLPLMCDFAEVTGTKTLFNEWGIDVNKNFEETFGDLYIKNEKKKILKIENMIKEYFWQLELSEKPTIYDHLLLSLREKDLVATFNWDPLLTRAYSRNNKVGVKLPRLVFLHGNVHLGYCKKDNVVGLRGRLCKKCRKPYENTPLLYPIKNKDYAKEHFISKQWATLKVWIQNAFMLTIFGYSGPKTDEEAISAMKEAWGNKNERAMEQTEFITIQSEDEVSNIWEPFIHTHHYEVHTDFYDSWIANHPRRTGEAYLNQYYEVKFINKNPIPRNIDFQALWDWYQQFKDAEDKSNI